MGHYHVASQLRALSEDASVSIIDNSLLEVVAPAVFTVLVATAKTEGFQFILKLTEAYTAHASVVFFGRGVDVFVFSQ